MTRRSLGNFAEIEGRVITPEDSTYDEARTVYYGGFDKRPAAIVRVANDAAVRRVVRMARDEGRELAVRSGGHSLAGHSTTDGGIVLDLRDMSKIEIDADDRTVWAEAGATALEVTEAAARQGMAVGFGDSGSVGVGGITLGGGIGFLVRKFGLTIDSLLAADVVTADGRLLRTDAEQNPDLFWAIRGGGGNFGVATRLKFRLHDLPHFTGGFLVLPANPQTIAGFTAAAKAAPDELSTIANIMPAPPMPFIPEAVHGQLVVLGMMAFAGDDADAERALAPFRKLATPLADTVAPSPYPAMYPPEDHSFHPLVVARTLFVDGFDASTAVTIFECLSNAKAAFRVAQLRTLGGAVARVSTDATAYAHRDSAMLVKVAAFLERPEDRGEVERWVSDFAKAVQPDDSGAYVGFIGDEGEARVREAYPGATWDRLSRIKAKYDPTNLFRLNQNVPPAQA